LFHIQSILPFSEALLIKIVTDRFDDFISDAILKGISFSNILGLMASTDKLDSFIRNYLANNDYSLKDCYKCFFDILGHTDKFDNELSRSLKFDKLLIVTDLKFLATSTGEFKFDKTDYNSDSNDLNQISKIKLLRKITSLIKEQDAISNCKMRTEYFLRLKDFEELSLLEISKNIYLQDSHDTTMEMFVKTPFIDALQAKEKKRGKD